METLQEITTKKLHDETGKIVRAVRAGQKFRVTIDGGPGAILVPDASATDPGWEEIMGDVWAAQGEAGPTRANPVLKERSRRNYAARLRR